MFAKATEETLNAATMLQLSDMERSEYEETITDMNKQLAALFEHTEQIGHNNVQVERKVHEYEMNSKKVICALQHKLEDKNTIILKLEDRLAEVTKSRAFEQNVALKRIAELETNYNKMYERMSKVIKGLKAQVQQLDECRRSYDILMVKYEEQALTIKTQEKKHKARVHDLKQKHLAVQDAVKEQVIESLKSISIKRKKDQYQMCTAGYAERRLKELLASGETQV